ASAIASRERPGIAPAARRGARCLQRLGLVAVIVAAAALQGCGDGSQQQTSSSTSWVRHWNEIAVDASGLDHTPPQPAETRVFGENLGPGRASRAIAIVHIAIFDAVNAIAGGYTSYTGLAPAPPGASIKAAIGQAAHDTLVAMFPSQAATFDTELDDFLA